MTTATWAASAPADHEADEERRTASREEPRTAPAGITPEQVAAAKAIQRRTGKTFHLATRLFPAAIRHDTYVLYGFVRIADEVVDGPGDHEPEAQRAAIDHLRAVAVDDEPTDDPVLAAFQSVREARGIPTAEIEVFLDSMAADVDGARYQTADELDEYVRGSAAAVGEMMTAVMGVDDPGALPHAAALGSAFQLTNFLRDVREDVVELDRIYLPERTLRRHGASHADVERLAFDDRVAGAVRDELHRAEAQYREGVAGIRYLPRRCQFPVLAAAVLYAEYHRRIRDRGFDVLSSRPSLGTARKLAALARVGYHWVRTRDPEAAFYAASAIPRVPDEPPSTRIDEARGTAGRAGGRLSGRPGGNRGD